MRHYAQMSIEKLSIPGRNYIPFVGKNIPSISFEIPVKLPFVGRKSPFVTSSGFTLVELIVTMVIAAILVAFALPGMNTVTQNSRLITQNNNLISDINLARSEAIRSARTARICTWNSTLTPNAPNCDNNGNWSLGRVIWVDRNNNGVLDIALGELMRSREGYAPLTITLNQIQVGGNIDPIVINSKGQSSGQVTFALCDQRGVTFGKDLRLTLTGQFAQYPNAPASCL